MKIITITLNPAYDVHYNLKNFVPFQENYVENARIDAGGKGINVSRALTLNGIENTAYLIAGRENSSDFIRNVKQAGVALEVIEVEGRIRENITIHSPNTPETRISFDTFCVREEIIAQLEEKLLQICSDDTIIVFSGRIPKGVSVERVMIFLNALKQNGAKLSIDSNSFTFQQLMQISPWLIKPNQQEIASFANITTTQAALVTAKKLTKSGINHVIISMGRLGAAYATQDFSCIAKVPKISIKSTIGAGDSTIAGFIAAYSQNKPPQECIKTAMAFGTAACLTEGTKPPRPEDIAAILNQVEMDMNY